MPAETVTNTPKSIREPFKLALGAQDGATPALAGNPALGHTPLVAGQGTPPHTSSFSSICCSHTVPMTTPASLGAKQNEFGCAVCELKLFYTKSLLCEATGTNAALYLIAPAGVHSQEQNT